LKIVLPLLKSCFFKVSNACAEFEAGSFAAENSFVTATPSSSTAEIEKPSANSLKIISTFIFRRHSLPSSLSNAKSKLR